MGGGRGFKNAGMIYISPVADLYENQVFKRVILHTEIVYDYTLYEYAVTHPYTPIRIRKLRH